MNEDCLYLNVWTPGIDRRKRPVMVWIHGGTMVTGAGTADSFEGTALAKRGDVVVVTINYRLGALGLLYLSDLVRGERAPGVNMALLDQVAALRWVNENIEVFGGDPNNITVFGESSGSMCVASLMVAPSAKGLFHKAICQSGSLPPKLLSPSEAAESAEILLDALEIAPSQAEKLWELPAEAILQAQLDMVKSTFKGADKKTRRFRPHLIGDGGILPENPFRAIEQGAAKDISLLIGTNLDEQRFFLVLFSPEKLSFDSKELAQAMSRRFQGFTQEAIDVYTKAREHEGRSVLPGDILAAMETDIIFRYPSIRLAEAQQKYQENTFMYLMTWPSPGMEGRLGCCHGIDIPFIFGNFSQGSGQMLTGGGSEAKSFSNVIQDCWSAFARNGNPSTKTVGPWPAFDVEKRSTMILADKSFVEDAPLEDERKFLDTALRELKLW